MMASVSGRTSLNFVPEPSVEVMRTRPRMASMFRFTTSIPTPRPEISVTLAAVEKPGAKMRPWISASLMPSAEVMRPFSIAFLTMAFLSRPRPSSVISMTTLPPS